MKNCPVASLSNFENFSEGAPHQLLKSLRNQAPVVWEEEPISANKGHWNVFRKKEIDIVMKDYATFTNTTGPILEETSPDVLDSNMRSLNLLDPPQHREMRSIVDYAFKPRNIERWKPTITDIARNIIDKIIDKGQCELVSEVAGILPQRVICEMLGVPEEQRKHLAETVNQSILINDPDFSENRELGFAALLDLVNLGEKLAASHRSNPRNSITMELIQSQSGDSQLSDKEFGLLFRDIIVGGMETTRSSIAFGLYQLLKTNQYALLERKPELIPDAVEEILRYNAPTMCYRRTATRDVTIGGEKIKKGDIVLCWLTSANRDENSFNDPDIFDVSRNQRESVRTNYRTFGVGQHFCLGVHLARLEINVMLEEITSRMTGIRVLGEPRHVRSMFIDGFKEMNIAYEKRPINNQQ